MADVDGDVLPPVAATSLGIAWIALFGFRWIAAPLLLAAGVLPPSTAADLDDRVLIRLYLVLLAVTVVVIVLRAMRGHSRRSVESGGLRHDGRAKPPPSADR